MQLWDDQIQYNTFSNAPYAEQVRFDCCPPTYPCVVTDLYQIEGDFHSQVTLITKTEMSHFKMIVPNKTKIIWIKRKYLNQTEFSYF